MASLLVHTLLLGLPFPGLAQEIWYVYDELNRLVGVVDREGNAAEYVYDAAGNILQIKRFDVPAGASLAITLVYKEGTLPLLSLSICRLHEWVREASDCTQDRGTHPEG